MFFEQYETEPTLAVARFWLRYSDKPREDFEDRLPEKYAGGYKGLDAMERHISGRQWFVGDTPTLADIALYAYTHVADEGGFDMDRYPAVNAWLDRVAAMPGHVPMDD
jgi:glutathione S-transferase